MHLVVVNPSPSAKRKKPVKRNPKTPAPKAASQGAKPMAKHRSAAQRAATRKMLAANRRHRNPAPVHKVRHRVVRHRNPSPVRTYRRRRNPETMGSKAKDLFGSLMSKEGLMSIAAVAGTPTVTELLVGQFAASSTGYTRVAIKAAAGLALAYAAHKFVNKQMGLTVGLVVVGTAIAEGIHAYQAGNLLTSGTTATATQGYVARRMNGYLPAAKEPGMVYM